MINIFWSVYLVKTRRTNCCGGGGGGTSEEEFVFTPFHFARIHIVVALHNMRVLMQVLEGSRDFRNVETD